MHAITKLSNIRPAVFWLCLVFALAFNPSIAADCPFLPGADPTDTDADGIPDVCDNCILEANAAQRDTNADGFGNRCDHDLYRDGLVTVSDIMVMYGRLNSNDPDADFNGDGAVAVGDYLIMIQALGSPPGPTGLIPRMSNTRPAADAGDDQTALLTETIALDATGSTDADGDPLLFYWSITAAPATSTSSLSDPNAISPTLLIDVAGTYVIDLIVSDGSASSAADTVEITTTNSAPVVAAGPNQQTTLPADTVTLSGTATDDGLPGGTLTIEWSKISGPGTVTFGNSALLSSTAQFSSDGVYVLQLSADDGEFSPTDQLTVTVNPTRVLTSLSVTPPSAQLGTNTSQQFTATGLDQYGDSITVDPAWSTNGGSIDQAGLYVSGAAPGGYTVTATDGAVVANAAVTVTGSAPRNNHLSFADDYVEIADSDALDLTGGAFTISAWIRPTSWGENLQGRIVDHGGGSSGVGGWTFHLENKSQLGSPQALRLRVNDDSSSRYFSTTASIQLDEWQHVAVTYDGDALRFYVNGEAAGEHFGVPVPLARGSVIRIGANATSEQRFFEGAIDEVRLWNLALTRSELVSRMHAGLSGNEPGLVAYYPLDEGAGQTAADASPNVQHGELGSSIIVDSRDPAWTNTVPQNLPPVVVAGADQQVTLPDTASLTGIASDDGLPGGTLTATWSMLSGPGNVTFGDSAAWSTTAQFSADGVYVLQLTAHDGVLSGSDQVTVTVIDATPPTVTLTSPGPGILSDTVTLSADAADNVGVATVAFRYDSTLIGNDTTPPYSLDWDTTTVLNGTYTLNVEATDTAGNTASDSVPVTLDNGVQPNLPPTVDAGADQQVMLPIDTVDLSGTASDDGFPSGTLTTEWIKVSGPGTVTFGDSAALATNAQFSTFGVYELQLTADDGGLSSSDQLMVTVLEPIPDTEPPNLTILAPRDLGWVSGTIAIKADATDNQAIAQVRVLADGVEVGIDDTPPYRVDWATRQISNGNYTITVIATDAAGNQDSESVDVVVDNPTDLQDIPVPFSSVITGFEFADPDTMVLEADQSDGWQIVWADDGNQYTAYGDGWGFRHESPIKLSMGFAKIVGSPSNFNGINLFGPDDIPAGSGTRARKTSGLVLVDDVIYQFARNADNNGHGCQLAYSDDFMQSWTWMSWKIMELGYCSFLYFGQNYAGARDNYVYMYSPNTDQNNIEVDEYIMARVPKDKITVRNEYEFLSGFDGNGNPQWSSDIDDRFPTLVFPNGANRLEVTYVPGIDRYLMLNRSRGRGGGLNHFSIFDAPEPWGPWTAVYYTTEFFGTPLPNQGHGGWDESQRIPAKWIAPDGESFHVICACFDSFGVIEAFLSIAETGQ